MALLAVVAKNGYHGVATYVWLCQGMTLGKTPLLYCGRSGVYSCTVSVTSGSLTREFHVESMI